MVRKMEYNFVTSHCMFNEMSAGYHHLGLHKFWVICHTGNGKSSRALHDTQRCMLLFNKPRCYTDNTESGAY